MLKVMHYALEIELFKSCVYFVISIHLYEKNRRMRVRSLGKSSVLFHIQLPRFLYLDLMPWLSGIFFGDGKNIKLEKIFT